jgi:hypothetical protein
VKFDTDLQDTATELGALRIVSHTLSREVAAPSPSRDTVAKALYALGWLLRGNLGAQVRLTVCDSVCVCMRACACVCVRVCACV